jgi:hypothetical protein
MSTPGSASVRWQLVTPAEHFHDSLLRMMVSVVSQHSLRYPPVRLLVALEWRAEM